MPWVSHLVYFILAADVGALAYGLSLYLMLLVVPGIVTLLKGQRLVFVAGLVLAGTVWVVASFRLARPDSWWARRFYSGAKLDRARRRCRT